MRLVIQRVIRAELWINNQSFSKIGRGLVAFVGVAKQDTPRDAEFLVSKLTGLRAFSDSAGKMNLTAAEVGGELMLVSNFTLYGDLTKGKRPSFSQAASPEEARGLYEYFVSKARESGLTVATGLFQADMRVLVENDGPVTLICESSAK